MKLFNRFFHIHKHNYFQVVVERNSTIEHSYDNKENVTFFECSTENKKLCKVREVFDEFNLVSSLHSFLTQEDEIYENILPPLSLLNLNDKKRLIEDLNKLNFNYKK